MAGYVRQITTRRAEAAVSQGSATLLASCVVFRISHSTRKVKPVFLSMEGLCLDVPIAGLNWCLSIRSPEI